MRDMGSVIEIGDHRPHKTEYVACMACAHDWVAVYPATTSLLECPKCQAAAGEAVKIHDVEWFKRFMAGNDTKRRTLVLLNANRMGL
jgi:hypothetical protein